MGCRHVVVVDGELYVVGIITRSDMNEHHLAHYWQEQVAYFNTLYVRSTLQSLFCSIARSDDKRLEYRRVTTSNSL